MRATLKTIKTSLQTREGADKTTKLKKSPFSLTDGSAMDRSFPPPLFKGQNFYLSPHPDAAETGCTDVPSSYQRLFIATWLFFMVF
jgi:hypothetical protein